MATQLQQAIVARRKKLKLSQSEVAATLGMSQPRYSQMESDPSSLSVARLLSLTALLGIELHVGLKEERQTPAIGGEEPKW